MKLETKSIACLSLSPENWRLIYQIAAECDVLPEAYLSYILNDFLDGKTREDMLTDMYSELTKESECPD